MFMGKKKNSEKQGGVQPNQMQRVVMAQGIMNGMLVMQRSRDATERREFIMLH